MATKEKNVHADSARQAFGSWAQAEHHAKQLLDSGEISKSEFNQIKAQASKSKHQRQD